MCLFVGKSGSRKTVHASSFPGPIYIFDTDGRTSPIKAYHSTRDDIEYDTYRSGDWAKYKSKMDRLKNNNPYRTVIFDSLTSIADMTIHESKYERKSAGMVRSTMRMAEPGDYNFESNAIMEILMCAQLLKCHIILTAHLLKVEVPEKPGDATAMMGKTIPKYSLITASKKSAEKVPGYFDEVYFFESENSGMGQQTVVYFRGVNSEVQSKTSLPALPDSMVLDNNTWLFPEIKNRLRASGIGVEIPEPSQPLPEVEFVPNE